MYLSDFNLHWNHRGQVSLSYDNPYKLFQESYVALESFIRMTDKCCLCPRYTVSRIAFL